jgi:hypothetical protein
MKKIEEKNKKDSTFNKAADDEVLFILRGQDNSSPRVICEWIKANIYNASDGKLKEAFECALEMRKTLERKSPD